MAETLGLRGPCTAPRRRCCPAWRWTATAWVRPRPDACPLRACRARCRLGSTWPASTSTRTLVSTLRRVSPRSPPQIQGGRPRKYIWVCSPAFATVARRLPLGLSTGVRAVSALGAGRPLGPGQRPIGWRPRTGARCSAASPGARFLTSLRKLEPSGANATPEPLRLTLGWSFQNLGEKPVLHSLRHSLPELESILDKRLCQRGWAPVPFLASPLIPSFSIRAVRGLQPAPNAWGCGEDGNPSPGTLVSGGGRRPSGAPRPLGEQRSRNPHPGRRAATPAPGALCTLEGRGARRRRRNWAPAAPKLGDGSGARAEQPGSSGVG